MPPDGDDRRPTAAKGKCKAASQDASTPKPPPINAALLLDAALPRLAPLDLDVAHLADPDGSSCSWTPLASCDSHVPASAWLSIVELHVEFPERSSSSILRAEVLTDEQTDAAPSMSAWTLQRTLVTRLLPRRARLDSPMLQRCLFYERHSQETDGVVDAMVVYVPMADAEVYQTASLPSSPDEVPYYFPRVQALCIRYESAAAPTSDTASTSSDSSPSPLGRCQLDVILFPADLDPQTSEPTLKPSSRLSRTALSLLTLQQTHAWGSHHSYVKRVTHDLLVDRALYLDTYSALKWRHAQRLVASWTERTDPAKHVFEDLGIAAFLMTLWKGMFGAQKGEEPVEDAPWDGWGRPPGGFVDVGCGNGLLVHILNAEGYSGFGLDLRERRSWKIWRALPGGADLRTISIEAPSMVLQGLDGEDGDDQAFALPLGSWLIGNHADELTPWLPLIAAATPGCSGFLNLPCCPWKLDGSRYTGKQTAVRDDDVADLLFPGSSSEDMTEPERELVREAMQQVRRGPQANVSSSPSSDMGTTSRTAAYLALISLGHLEAGWELEKEALRIPSTRNWALIGRRRLWEEDLGSDDPKRRRRAGAHQEHVRGRLVRLAKLAQPSWTARTPEGNAGKDSH